MGAIRRIGIYGGTFDPVHLGHLEVAKKVSQLFEFDEVLFVPARIAPHKVAREVTSPLHRYAMLALATNDDPRFLISNFELETQDGGYTVNTVAHFEARFSGLAQLFFIMGADSWSEITTWREWERLLGMTNHLVATRPAYDIKTDHLPATLRDRIVDIRGATKLPPEAKVSGAKMIFITDVAMVDVSATAVRSAAREDRFADLLKLVPAQVAEYIRKYGLYRDSNETQLNR